MDGFKNTTRMTNMDGGSCYAKGGSVKGAAKVGKVMGEFKSGKLHSGSKSGPTVTNPKQAMAIAMSEAGKSKTPMKKAEGGAARNRMPPIGDSVDSGNRMSKMNAADRAAVLRTAKKSVPVASRLPLIGDSVDSGNRMSKMNAADRAAVLRTTPRAKGGVMKKASGLAAMPKGASKNNGPARKYANGGPVTNQPMGQTTAAYGAKLREQIKAGTMTNAQAQAAHNAFVKQQMSPRALAAAENASATLRAASGPLARGLLGAGAKQAPTPPKQPTRDLFAGQKPPVDPGIAIDRPRVSTPQMPVYDRGRSTPEMPMVLPPEYGRGFNPMPVYSPPMEQVQPPSGGYYSEPMQPSSGGYLGTNMTKSQLRQSLLTPPTLFGTPAPFTPPMQPSMEPPMPTPVPSPASQAPAAMTQVQQPMTLANLPPAIQAPVGPLGFRMGGLAVMPRGGRY
jgi:hypothetical protein